MENQAYKQAIYSINSEEYFVENVSAFYISKEHLDEVAFNWKSNLYFGYSLEELDKIFKDTKYIFTLSEDGTTTVEELQFIENNSTETIIKNVAVGTGEIFLCVTIAAVSAGVGTSAISVIFATSAAALSSAH